MKMNGTSRSDKFTEDTIRVILDEIIESGHDESLHEYLQILGLPLHLRQSRIDEFRKNQARLAAGNAPSWSQGKSKKVSSLQQSQPSRKDYLKNPKNYDKFLIENPDKWFNIGMNFCIFLIDAYPTSLDLEDKIIDTLSAIGRFAYDGEYVRKTTKHTEIFDLHKEIFLLERSYNNVEYTNNSRNKIKGVI